MTKKASLILSMVALFIISSGMIYKNVDLESTYAQLNVRIEKDSEDVWRVRDLNGNSRGTLNASANDRVQWQNRSGGEVVFTFAEDVEQYFEFRGNLFEDGRSQVVGANENLRVTIKESAPTGELIYEVFVIDERKFVQGSSAPRMIIQ
ncbi:MAG: hypothetical protein GVY20_06750 [Bacteroidetes bacterium]|jgi:uncharacterized surface anchored protein|nr:hypothetical protein [Bacteroidota bacterium]